jgi:hypothetical protein
MLISTNLLFAKPTDDASTAAQVKMVGLGVVGERLP